ncbi:MAG: hypothetical protein RJQ14_26165 [Marinoscillum sp.]
MTGTRDTRAPAGDGYSDENGLVKVDSPTSNDEVQQYSQETKDRMKEEDNK